MNKEIRRKSFLSSDKTKNGIIYSLIQPGKCIEGKHNNSPEYLVLIFEVMADIGIRLVNTEIVFDMKAGLDKFNTSVLVSGLNSIDTLLKELNFFVTNYKNLSKLSIENHKEHILVPVCATPESDPLTVNRRLELSITHDDKSQLHYFTISTYSETITFPIDEAKRLLKELTRFRKDVHIAFRPLLAKSKSKSTANKK